MALGQSGAHSRDETYLGEGLGALKEEHRQRSEFPEVQSGLDPWSRAELPAGFTADGLPVAIQIVGRHRDDFGVLQLAHAFEQATGFGHRRPAIALN